MPFEKGKSGNAKGRPQKNRALTTILEKAGNDKVSDGVKPIARKKLLANLLWQAAASGQVTFPDGTTKQLDIQDWTGVVKFIYQHIDGPPKTEMDITSDGAALLIKLDK